MIVPTVGISEMMVAMISRQPGPGNNVDTNGMIALGLGGRMIRCLPENVSGVPYSVSWVGEGEYSSSSSRSSYGFVRSLCIFVSCQFFWHGVFSLPFASVLDYCWLLFSLLISLAT